MIPRDVFFMAIGVILGVAMQGRASHGDTCACNDCERARWKQGKDILQPACCRRAKQEGLDAEALHAELGEHEHRGCVPPIARPNPEATNICRAS